MRKLSKIMSALLALSASNQLYAEQIQGTVINENGAVVVGATVKVMGTSNATVTNEQGLFSLEVKPGNYELHVVAEDFVHENVAVNVFENKNAQLSVSLDKSAIEIIDISATPFHSSNIESA